MSEVRLINANDLQVKKVWVLINDEQQTKNGLSFGPLLCVLKEDIDNATTVDTPTYTDVIEANKEGYNTARRLYERPQGECENCDFRKFTEKFVDGVVEVMNENGITSIEQLSEILKGGTK